MQIRVVTPLDRLFFPLVVLTAVTSVAAGFAPTYYLGFWFHAPPLTTTVHIHALAFTAWLLLLLSQTLLIRGAQYPAGTGRWASAGVRRRRDGG